VVYSRGMLKATVQRVWSARGLKPHLVKTFKLSNDPTFEEKLIEVSFHSKPSPILLAQRRCP
jgi:hypothetical protein